jgi:hypothetical protein
MNTIISYIVLIVPFIPTTNRIANINVYVFDNHILLLLPEDYDIFPLSTVYFPNSTISGKEIS